MKIKVWALYVQFSSFQLSFKVQLSVLTQHRDVAMRCKALTACGPWCGLEQSTNEQGQGILGTVTDRLEPKQVVTVNLHEKPAMLTSMNRRV